MYFSFLKERSFVTWGEDDPGFHKGGRRSHLEALNALTYHGSGLAVKREI